MKRYFIALFVASIVSWPIAFYLQDSAKWWVRKCPNWMWDFVHAIVTPILSKDISIAEDQVNFYIYLVPMWLILALIFCGIVFFAVRKQF